MTPAIPSHIESTLANLSLEQQVGQVMMLGFDGTTLTPDLRQLIGDLHIGGIVLFERNIESPTQVAQLTQDLQTLARANSDPGLLSAIDQEGGVVARLKEPRGFTEFPGAMAIAATDDVENVRRIARAQAEELRAVGIHINLAPDLDVNNNPANPVISTRSFGSDPGRVAQFGAAYIHATQDAGILAVGKHFPGHGDTGIDSHLALPAVPHDRAWLEHIEFVPFRAAINARVAGIMSAHVTFPAIEPRNIASTLSPRVLTDLLRDEMQFDGLILTDSLEMGALGTSGYPPPIAAATALQAGADVLLFNTTLENYRAVHAEILTWVRAGKIPQARLNDAVRRVLRAKQRVAALDASRPALDRVGTPETKELSRTVARQAVTLVRDDAQLLPLGSSRTLVVETIPLGLGERLGASTMSVSAQTTRAEIEAVQNTAPGFERVVIATSDVLKNPDQAKLVAALKKINARTIVVATRSPYDLLYLKDITTYLAIYGANPPMIEALADVLTGKIQSRGKLPVTLEESK
jgi:beta-N-acetylhexosaminidase